jgi:hypothetical protein
MGLISKIGAMFQPKPATDTSVSHALALIAKSVDPALMALPGAQEKLIPAIEFALDYYRRVVDQIPGPVSIATANHDGDDVMRSLFPAASEIGNGLGRSIAVRDSINWFVDRGHDRITAVMGMRVRSHAGNGGNAFADHTFRSLGADEHDTRECICAAAFTSLVKAYTDRMKDKRREWGLLHTEGRIQQELKSRGNGSNTAAASADNGFADRFAGAVQTPNHERALDVLVDWLHAPEQRLRLETGDGHPMVGNAGTDGKSLIQMPTLASADRRRWLVCLVDFPLQEALDAIKRESQSHRYILI